MALDDAQKATLYREFRIPQTEDTIQVFGPSSNSTLVRADAIDASPVRDAIEARLETLTPDQETQLIHFIDQLDEIQDDAGGEMLSGDAGDIHKISIDAAKDRKHLMDQIQALLGVYVDPAWLASRTGNGGGGLGGATLVR